jgi:hypothetical protein
VDESATGSANFFLVQGFFTVGPAAGAVVAPLLYGFLYLRPRTQAAPAGTAS